MTGKIIKRGLLGLPLGIAIGYVISLITSICIGDGSFYPVTAELIEATGNVLSAVIIQTILCGLMGAGYAMASVIWEIDSWSLAKQSGIYFAIASIIMFPVAYVTNWMEHSVMGFIIYAGVFVGIFIAVWLTQYFAWKSKIRKLNEQVQNR